MEEIRFIIQKESNNIITTTNFAPEITFSFGLLLCLLKGCKLLQMTVNAL